jgi:hypothetical protein
MEGIGWQALHRSMLQSVEGVELAYAKNAAYAARGMNRIIIVQ